MPRQPGAAIMCKEHQVAQGPSRLESVISLAKRRGFVFPCGDIYGGTRSAWDYGPLGVELKENRLFAFKGVGGVGIPRSGGGSVGGSFGG